MSLEEKFGEIIDELFEQKNKTYNLWARAVYFSSHDNRVNSVMENVYSSYKTACDVLELVEAEIKEKNVS